MSSLDQQAANEGWNPEVQPRAPDGKFLPDGTELIESLAELALGDSVIVDADGERVSGTVTSLTSTGVGVDGRLFDEPEAVFKEAADVRSRVQDASNPQVVEDIIEDEYDADLQINWYQLEQKSQAKIVADSMIDVAEEYGEDAVQQKVAVHDYLDSWGQTGPTGSIEISVDGLNWRKIRQQGDQGWLSTTSDKHVVLHEFGHRLHQRQLSRSQYWDLKNMGLSARQESVIKEEISEYAAESPLEFVAEAFVLKMAEGEEIPDIVKPWYEEFGGP
jgi:hypothetical protein